MVNERRSIGGSCDVGHADMIWIPSGTFRMGSDEFYFEERPVHEVAVNGFWIDRHPVTKEQFARFVAETGYLTVAERALNPADFPGAPVENLVPGSMVFHRTNRLILLVAGATLITDINCACYQSASLVVSNPRRELGFVDSVGATFVIYKRAYQRCSWSWAWLRLPPLSTRSRLSGRSCTYWDSLTTKTLRRTISIRDTYFFYYHWGVMVGFMGVVMVVAAFKKSWRHPVVFYSFAEKAGWSCSMCSPAGLPMKTPTASFRF